MFRVLTFCFLLPLTSLAQQYFGVKVGPNLANQRVSNDPNSYGFRPGLQAGAFGGMKLNKWNFQAEILYTNLGTRIKVNFQEHGVPSIFNYVAIPLSASRSITKNISIQVGPRISVLTLAESEYNPTSQTYQSGRKDFTGLYKNFDAGVQIGFVYAFADTGLILDFNYYIGLLDISNHYAVRSTQNRAFQASVGYKILRF